MSYDDANDDSVCAADPCNEKTSSDVAKCCKDSDKAKCLTIGDDNARATFCNHGSSGKVYNPAAANAQCAAGTCTTSTAGDITACCAAKCSTIATTPANFCQTGSGGGATNKLYNSANANAPCAAATCSSDTSADITACCAAKAKCSSIGAGAADQNAARATFCGSDKVYNPDADDDDCVGLTCTTKADGGDDTDVNTCCSTGGAVSGRLDVKQEALLQGAALGQGGSGHS